MKIKEIQLWNFRQFYGQTKIALACDDDRNVTLIHGENGVGKTTLLNAVYWAMFGDVTPRFEQKSRMINFEAEREGITEARVEVEFEFNGENYRVSRAFRKDARETDFKVSRIDRGSLVPLPAPATFVNSVIPKNMARYFFFDGEHAESFAAEQNQTAGSAIRSMLGCDLAEEGIKDLKAVATQFTRQMGDGSGDDELKRLKDELGKAEEKQAQDEAELSDHRKSIDQLAEQKALVDEALRRMAGAREVQELRDQLQLRKQQVEADLVREQSEIIRWIGEKAISVVGRKLALETASFINAESVEGRLPVAMSFGFILEGGMLIGLLSPVPREPGTDSGKVKAGVADPAIAALARASV